MNYPLDTFYSRIYKRYDLINRLFTLGMDKSWRKYTAVQCLRHNPAEVLDLCCGTGELTLLLSGNNSKEISITGFDLNTQMLDRARQKTKQKGCGNIRYVQGNVSHMPFHEASFDSITIGFGFRNLTYDNPGQNTHMKEIYRVLKKGGRLFILESGMPEIPWIRFFFRLYLCLVLIPVGFLLSGDRRAYSYLARSSAGFFSVDEISQFLSGKGFVMEARKKFFLGAANLIIARKP
jgi:demethylmenaquinone methyltransferase/2-methoxy-6-polyprenyl-1,4-benzoquinol methylase